jgi:opacity protein-like surface antigen
MGASRVRVGVATALASLCCSAAASADQSMFQFSGFGTAGYAITDTSKAEFGRPQQASGAKNQGDIGVDSLLGVQGTAHLSDAFTFTTQLMARRLYGTGIDLDVSLMFAKWQVDKDLSFRVGRVQMPVTTTSDYKQVGYANTWVRPPIEIANVIPFDYIDGADTLYRKDLGPVSVTGQALFGKADLDLAAASLALRHIWNVNASATMGPLTLRASRTEFRFTVTAATLTELLSTVSAVGFPALANSLSATNDFARITEVGLVFDWHDVIAQGELIKAQDGGFIPSRDDKELLVGYRIAKFTPYAIYSMTKVTSAETQTTIPEAGPLLPLALGIDSAMGGVDQHTVSLGTRWDFHDSLDLKFQADHISFQGAGLFINPLPGFKGPVNMASLTLDFVF